MELTIREFINIIKKRWKLIIIISILGSVLALGISRFVIARIYRTTVVFYITTQNDSKTSADITLAQRLVTSYVNVMKSNKFCERLVENSNLPYSNDELLHMISFKTTGNSEQFSVQIDCPNAANAKSIGDSIVEQAPGFIADYVAIGQLKVVDSAILPQNPLMMNAFLVLFYGFVIGFVLSIIIVVTLNRLDPYIYDVSKLKLHYSNPILSIIPLTKNQKIEQDIENEESILSDSATMEAYNMLQFSLLSAMAAINKKCLLITSCLPAAGKSTVSANIAISLTQTEHRVLLIDCDLRKPRLNRFFKEENTPGLTNYLGGFNQINETIRNTRYERLDFMPAGSIPPNPAELLASNRMGELLNNMNERYEFIILNSAPVNLVSDTLALVRHCPDIALVLRPGQHGVTYVDINESISRLELVKANLLGFIISGGQQDKKI